MSRKRTLVGRGRKRGLGSVCVCLSVCPVGLCPSVSTCVGVSAFVCACVGVCHKSTLGESVKTCVCVRALFSVWLLASPRVLVRWYLRVCVSLYVHVFGDLGVLRCVGDCGWEGRDDPPLSPHRTLARPRLRPSPGGTSLVW